MSTKTVSARLEGDGLRLVATTGSGHEIVMDDGLGDAGPRPSELLVVAQAGCTAMDVVSILRKKRQPVAAYRIEVRGEQRPDHPRAFRRIDILHLVDGEWVDPEAVRRSIELSVTRYCAVTAQLSSGDVAIVHRYRLGDGAPVTVAETGPFGHLVVLAASSTPGVRG